jgi:hypothetical protein
MGESKDSYRILNISDREGWCSRNALDLYSRGARFVVRPGHRISCLRFMVIFFSHSRQLTEPRLGYDRFLPNPFQFSIQQSSYHSKLQSRYQKRCKKPTKPHSHLPVMVSTPVSCGGESSYPDRPFIVPSVPLLDNCCEVPVPLNRPRPRSCTRISVIIRISLTITLWTRILTKKLTAAHMVEKFPAFYGTQTVFTTFKRTRHRTLS